MPGRFRTTEISDPQFESDHLRFITVKTPNLQGRGDICLFVPPDAMTGSLPLVTLLHGVYGSAWIWSQKAGVHRTALRLIARGEIPPMIIAMPSDGLWADGSGYAPHNARDFEAWIVDDVPSAVIENIPELNPEAPRFLSGLSMGGYGALRLGAKYGAQFAGISAHSSMTEFRQMADFVEEPLASYGSEAERAKLSLYPTILDHRADLPPIRFDCGSDDPLVESNRQLHAQLQAAGVPHLYEEFPGGHEWPYWTRHIADTLRWFASRL